MFDIGFWEFFLVIVVSLIVVGPNQMPNFVSSIGKFIANIKRFVYNTTNDLRQEFHSLETHKSIGNNTIFKTIKETQQDINDSLNK